MIGVFDSGLGGLTVLKEIKKVLPEYDYMYYGDTLHVPYGNRSDEAIFELTRNACEYLFAHGCKLIILACNTASAKALRRLQSTYLSTLRPFNFVQGGQAQGDKYNILGVIKPVAEEVAKISKGNVGVIGTRGTIESNAYKKELETQNIASVHRPALKVVSVATPLLVPLIEEGWIGRKETKSILRNYLRKLKNENVDTLILGCTHYPLLIRQIQGIMGRKCKVPNPAVIVANSLVDYLSRHPEIEKNLGKNGLRKYLVTDLNENFLQQAKRFLQEDIQIESIKS